MSNFGPPLQTHSFTSSALLHHRARAGLSAQTALEISQHYCTTKQIEYSNATASPSLQLQRLGTKGMTLQLELKVRSGETPRNMSLSNLLWESQAAITTPPTATTKQTTTYHRSKRSWVRFRAGESRREETGMLKLPCKISISQLSTQVEAVSVQNSQDWIMVQAIARALEVCATALHRYSKQSPNCTQID